MRKLLIIAVTAVLGLGVGACASAGNPKTTSAKVSDVAAAKPSAASSPTTAIVPRLVGMGRADARAALRRAGLRLGVVESQPSAQSRGSVLQQGVAAGAALSLGAVVDLTVAAPLPQVPDVVGATKASAISDLKSAGFAVRTSTKRTTSGADNVVLSESPAGGDRAKPGTAVTLVISDLHKPVTLSSSGGSNCTPGYSPCLPPASDYDCEGGSGDGPKYTGYVTVTGSDPYDLDNDGDGVACES